MKKLVLMILLILLLAVPVMADEVSVSSWEELSDAVAVEERTIILTQDISTDSAGDGLFITGNIIITGQTIDVLQSGTIFVIDGGNLTLRNTNLTNATNSAVVLYDGKFTMDGGNITNCTSEQGGGVCVMYGEFIMIDGNITDCSADYSGDGVMVYPEAIMTARGGNINGVYVSTDGVLNIENTPIIDNLYLESENSLTVIDEISSPAEIHITNPVSVGKFGNILADSDLNCFIAENLEAVRDGNDLNWMTAYNISVNTDKITPSKSKSRAGVEIGLTITPDYGYELDTLSVDNPFIMPEQDVVISATFRGVKVPVTFDGVGMIEEVYGSPYILPATPSKSGYNFVGWFKDGVEIDYVTDAEAHTVYARWSAVPQKQSASSSKGTSIWLKSTSTPTPTPVPTVVQPTVIQPTVIPITKEVTTPVPILGVMLGLLFVLRRK